MGRVSRLLDPGSHENRPIMSPHHSELPVGNGSVINPEREVSKNDQPSRCGLFGRQMTLSTVFSVQSTL